MEQYDAVYDVVVIKQDEAEQKNAAGFYTHADLREAPWRGVVLAFGEKTPEGQLWVGQKVYFKKYAGHEVEIEGEKVMLVPYEDVLLKEKKKN